VLIDKIGTLKIADFGLARAFGVPLRAYTHEVVTLWYRAPEIFLGAKVYSTCIDVWSVGCIFAEMAAHTALFEGDSEIDMLFRMFKQLGTPNAHSWPHVNEHADWNDDFPVWKGTDLAEFCPNLSSDGVDLLNVYYIIN